MASVKGIVSTISQSLKGEQQDYTQGSIPRAVILLAIPMILELSLESVFAVVDMFFVGRLGRNAISTVGLTESVITLVYSIAVGLSTGATAIVARRIGEKNPEEASHAAAQSLIVGFLVTMVISAAGLIFAPDILTLMGAAEEVVKEGAVFARIMFGGSLAIISLFLINGIFRGAGDASMAMKSLWVASGANIVLCPIFIHFFGLTGAAMATVTGRSAGVLYQSYHLFHAGRVIRLRLYHFRFNGKSILSILRISWPATMQFILGSGSWIVLVRLVAETGGPVASAGCQIAFRNFVFFILPAWGLGNAAATLVGQNLGAKQVQRAEQSVYLITKYNTVFMSMVMMIFLSFAEPIVRIFTQDETVVASGAHSLRILGSGFVLYGISMVMTQALNGSGDTRTPTLINFACFWVFQIPFAYLLTYGFDLKPSGALLAIPFSHALIALTSWYYFKKGRWKTIVV